MKIFSSLCLNLRHAAAVVLLLGSWTAASAQNVADDANSKLREAIMGEVKQQGLEKKPEVQKALDAARQTVLLQAWERQFVSSLKFTDEQRTKVYQELMTQLGNKEYRLRHILLADEAAAKLLIEKIQAGTELAALTAEYSKDGQTKEQGGLTGWTNKLDLSPELRAVVDQLTKGKVHATPVRTAVGWHVLELAEVRELKPPAQSQITSALDQQLARQALVKKFNELQTKNP